MSRPSHDGRRTAGGPRGRATASRHRPAAHITAPRPKSGTPQATRATAPLVRPDQLAFTIVTASHGRPLAKRFWLDSKTDELKTKTVVALTRGTARIEYAPSLAEFAERVDALTTSQAVLYGIPPLAKAAVVTQDQYEGLTAAQRQGVITRSREHLQFAHAPGCAMLDFDPAGAPSSLLTAIASPDQTRELLIRAVPELAAAPMLWRPSSSSYLYRGRTELHGLRGQRIYIAVARASDIPLLGQLLYERLWALGYGYVVVSASGQLLDRTLLDASVWQPERLDFAAGPTCVPPLERRVPRHKLWHADAPFFDPRLAAGLTPLEQRAIESKRKAARAAQLGAARERRASWAEARGVEIAKRTDIDPEAAVALAFEAVEQRMLRSDFVLTSEDGEPVAVRELLAHPEVWHGRRFRDPLEPDYRDDERIAYANLRPVRGQPYVFSHAHGGVRYTLATAREVIRLVQGDLPRVVDQCSKIMTGEAELYQLKDAVVRVTEGGRLAPVEPEWIVDRLQRRADFVRPKKVDGVWEDLPADLAPKYAKTLLAKSGEMGLPSLVAITAGPFLRDDGSVVAEPGYDEATQVLYHPGGPPAPPVRAAPTVPMATEALEHLWAPFREFPFADEVDRGAVLALLLTAALRPGIAIAPGGLIESHDAGSGKTLCAQAIANLTGAPAIPQAMAQGEEEIRKALFSAARAGTPSVLYDNVGRDRAIDSASLAMVLTSGTLADRILGESTYASVPFRALILLTGNNTRIAGDLNRRLLRVRITPSVENPWTRVFAFCPRARTEAMWRTLRVAALELVRAALTDGPPPLGAGSGYPEWDALARATVCWVAQRLDIGVRFADPVASLLAGYEDDPERDRLRRVLTAWDAAFGPMPITVGQLLEAVNGDPITSPVPETGPRREAMDQLREVFQELDGRQRGNHAHAIGIYLNQQKGRIVDGLALVKDGKHCGSSRWLVRQTTRETAQAA